MKIIVDANIVFSGILNSGSKIGDLLINSGKIFHFIAPDFLRYEIRSHHDKIMRFSKMTIEQVLESEYQICKSIVFINEEQISPYNWDIAFDLVKNIDPKDVSYVAFSKQFRCKIWSGDKELIKGLAAKEFRNFVTTDVLFKIRETEQLKQQK